MVVLRPPARPPYIAVRVSERQVTAGFLIEGIVRRVVNSDLDDGCCDPFSDIGGAWIQPNPNINLLAFSILMLDLLVHQADSRFRSRPSGTVEDKNFLPSLVNRKLAPSCSCAAPDKTVAKDSRDSPMSL
jgi:hypothetical protein